jgi:hypothetical protein
MLINVIIYKHNFTSNVTYLMLRVYRLMCLSLKLSSLAALRRWLSVTMEKDLVSNGQIVFIIKMFETLMKGSILAAKCLITNSNMFIFFVRTRIVLADCNKHRCICLPVRWRRHHPCQSGGRLFCFASPGSLTAYQWSMYQIKAEVLWCVH